jgi:hypothetical protein
MPSPTPWLTCWKLAHSTVWNGYFAGLSRSRMGWNADVELSGLLVEELKKGGLAEDSRDDVSVPLHPTVRTTILVLLSQLSRRAGNAKDSTCIPSRPARNASAI